MLEEESNVDIVSFYDDLIEFNDYCSFLCDALSALLSEYAGNEFDSHTIQGVKRHCGDLKERSEKLESMLHTLYKQSYASSHVTQLKPST